MAPQRTPRVLLTDIAGQFGPVGDQARDYLHQHALRATPARIAIIATLAANPAAPATGEPSPQREPPTPGHLSAADLHHGVQAAGVHMDETTLYRTLATLEHLGLIHGTQLPNRATRYGLAQPAHHHGMCTTCSTLHAVPAQHLTALIQAASRELDITPKPDSAITFYGHCTTCRRSGKSPHQYHHDDETPTGRRTSGRLAPGSRRRRGRAF